MGCAMEAPATHRKRPSSDLEGMEDTHLGNREAKRIRTSSVSHDRSGNSNASTSATSACCDSSPERVQPSSISSVSSDEESLSESSLSSSSDDVSDAEEDEETVVTIGGPKKPVMRKTEIVGRDADDLKSRLSAFLPQLAAANASLGEAACNIEAVDEDQQYIEMDLSLGVLEEKRGGDNSSSGSDSDGSESGDEDDGAGTVSRGPMAAQQRKSSENVMARLKGQDPAERKAGIEVV